VNILPAPVGIAIFAITFVVVRIVQERALRKLDTETKGRLVEALASHRLFALLPMAGIAAGYVAVSMLDGLSMATVLAIYFPAVIVFVAAIQISVHRKMLALGIDREFMRVYSMGRIAMFVGLAAFAAGNRRRPRCPRSSARPSRLRRRPR
jgi:hypothetical protein